MSSESKHIIYSIEDIHRYHSGKMTPVEMHAMERAALNDPLLADAMDGYTGLPGFSEEASLTTLKDQLTALKEKTGTGTISINKYKWWRAIAATIILGGFAFGLYKLLEPQKNQPSPIAKQETITEQTATITDTTKQKEQPVAAKNNAGTIIKTENNSKPVLIAAADDTQKKAATVPVTIPENYQLNDMEKSSAKVPATPGSYENGAKDLTIENASKEEKDLATNDGYQITNQVFSGNVVDNNNNNAVPYANLVINEQLQTKADANGYFNITLPDSVINVDVQAKNYYARKKTVISPGNANTIKLVAKRTTLRKIKQDIKTIDSGFLVEVLYKKNVEPKEGWPKYRAFLSDQLSFSAYDDGRPVKGETIVSFEVDGKLEPVNFTFEKSIDPDVDEAIEELILTGPEWKTIGNKAATHIVKLKIIF